MKAAEAMRRQYQTVGPEESVQAAAQRLAEGDGHALLVVEGGRLVGIVTERDITVRVVADAKPSDSTPVRDIMSSDVFTCAPESDAASIAAVLHERQIDQAPVLEGGKLLGLLLLTDLAIEFAPDRSQPSSG